MSKKTKTPSNQKPGTFDKHWHLGADDTEIKLADFEYSLYRIYAAFERWLTDCIGAAAKIPLNSTENTVLNVIRMKDRPKSLSEIGRLLNRDDISNLQYAIRKLLSAKLIEKYKGKKKKGVRYRVTKHGEQVTDDYAELRRKQLVPLLSSIHNWDALIEDSSRMLASMGGIYDSAALTVTIHCKPIDDDEN